MGVGGCKGAEGEGEKEGDERVKEGVGEDEE